MTDEKKATEESTEEQTEDYDFEATMKANAEKKKKAAKERNGKNKSVLRSYKIK